MNTNDLFASRTFLNMIRGNGVLAEQAKQLPLGAMQAKAIKVKGGLAVIFQCGTDLIDNPGYKITGDSNLLERVIIQMEGDTLVLKENASLQPAHRITIHLRLFCPERIYLEEQASCNILGITPQNNSLQISTKGTASLSLQGQISSYHAELAGAGDFRAEELQTQHAKFNILGVGCVWASVSHGLNIESDGPGDVVIYGNPKDKNIHATGAGSVVFMKSVSQTQNILHH